jgi:hypothetical protein
MDATDEAYLLLPSYFSTGVDVVWPPVVAIAVVFVFVFFSLVFEVRRIAHLEKVFDLLGSIESSRLLFYYGEMFNGLKGEEALLITKLK